MEFKQDDSCSVQKSSCFLEIPFFKLSLTKGTLYRDHGSIDYVRFCIVYIENIYIQNSVMIKNL